MKAAVDPTVLTARAPAKINLTLHVRGRRADGYHDLESLVVFAGVGDTLALRPGTRLSLTLDGPKAEAVGAEADNLVLRAARLLAEKVGGLRVGAFHLTKRLPVAAGLGGGSADAAAALRLMALANGLALDHRALRDAARSCGADVPVCLDGRARLMRGAGERLGPPLALPALFALLVNPGVAVATAHVFRGLNLAAGQAHRDTPHPTITGAMGVGGLLAALAMAGNELEDPARRLAPTIGEALAALGALPGCRLARMSGSGATVFGLFDDCRAVSAARRALIAARPGWWVKGTVLR